MLGKILSALHSLFHCIITVPYEAGILLFAL